ncbi:MAG: MOSC domain-containing protein [Thermomicrobiales bacterium]
MRSSTEPAHALRGTAGRLTAIYHYPIKSCAGTALASATLTSRGLLHDRELLVIDPATGHFLTQREAPRLALVRPAIADGELTVAAVGQAALTVPIAVDGPARPVVVWRDTCLAVDQGDAIAAWLGAVIGRPCRLVRMAEHFVRHVDPHYATSPRDQVGFADGFPVLVISEESLADLNARLATPLPMNRFRPNLVVSGGAPYAEDGWRRVRIGAIVFHLVKPCARCVITTTDQATAARGKEPLATLATYRRRGPGAMFGQNGIHETPGVIRVGDSIEVLEMAAPA